MAHPEHDKPQAATKAAARDTSGDAQKMLLFLTADWLNNDRTHAQEIGKLLVSITSALTLPVNVDVPHVSQSGGTLNCTMGNWQGEPVSYAYQWHSDGVANSATAPTYTIQPADSGHSLACTVTATNAMGSTAAPMSNAIAVT